MERRVLRVLEFDKIINMLAQHAASSLGRERALALIPVRNTDAIKKMQAETSEARAVLDLFGSVPLGGITDIRPTLEKSKLAAILQPAELLEVAHTLSAGRRLRAFLLKHKEDYPLLGELGDNIAAFEKLEQEITRSIGAGGEVVDSASPALGRIRSELRSNHSKIMQRLNGILSSSQYRTALQEPIITQREDRYCVPVKVEYRTQIRGIVHDESASGSTLFVEPEQIVELGNDTKRLSIKEREEVEKVLAALTRLVADAAPDALATMEAIAHVDFVVAKAHFSIAMNAVEPALNQNGYVRLVQARHPLLTGDVVPIDVELGKKFHALLITGPNTGGKTVTLKTVGLLTLMAQAGLHITARTGSELGVFDQIFADIGDEQSIEQSLSTFSSHIKNIVNVVRWVRPNVLVLFDEIGAGTDPAEGAALAKAILEFILERGARVIATTHYGELKEFAFAREGIQNASVEFDIETLRPTYRLMMGVPGSSNAFAIAARLGMPKQITKAAEAAMSGQRDGSDEIIRRIEESHREAMEDQRTARSSAEDAEKLRQRYEEKLAKLEIARAKLEDEARETGRKLVDKYEKQLDEALAKLSEVTEQSKKGKEAEQVKHAARQTVREARRELARSSAPIVDEAPEDDDTLRKGDPVRITSLNQEGILSEISDDQATVVVGSMKLTVPLSSLRRGEGKRTKVKPTAPTGISVTLAKATNISPEITLRGQRVEDALYDLDTYLYDAQTAGLEEVRIIHGKGTGAMRSAVTQHLRNHPAVKSYKLAEQAEGGSGATTVKLNG